MGEQLGILHTESLEQWRAWLRDHHGTEKGIWLAIAKKGSGIASVSDADAAEEALCFGWIDSIIKKLDDATYLKKFTPRTNTAKWSEFNITRVKKLMDEGRMQEPGRAKIPDEILEENYISYTHKPPAFIVPAELLDFLSAYPLALENFNAFPVSAKKVYCGWIMSGKKEETRRKRMAEAVGLLEKNIRNPMK